jgi:hypothetical protein
MIRCYKVIPVCNTWNRYLTGSLYPVILFGILFTSFTLLADQPPDIAKYTLQREKTSEFLASSLRSGKRPELEINEQGGVYQIKVVALIAAPASYVRYVLTDYTHIYRLNPSIIESEVLKQDDDGSVNVRTKVIGCAAYFCEELERVEKVHLLPSGDIQADIVPELSQFKSGQTLWHIQPRGDYCEVTYFSTMEPDIYIPPLVGEFLIKKSIRDELQISFTNLENISSVLAQRKWNEDYRPADKPAITEAASSGR